ncbi:MAG TPA: SAM-dependent methyltransferase [Alphaproteobacteria bacterium]|jgi:trans-aconitate methyltransferase|nr:SAM-dependent methyltransferase [Alphaproteobacteria bacterium]HBF97379.1 SAM-dependent methyltransferase [Alphaproteobacteria bacterium]
MRPAPQKGQQWQAQSYAHHARFVADLALPVVELLAPQMGEQILDLGCGDAALTREIADRGGNVIGIDESASMVEAACAAGVSALRADACALPFGQQFDAVFSNAVLHWIDTPDRPIKAVWEVLKPGGRFVAEFGGHGCVATILTAMRAVARVRGYDEAAVCPWYFPTVDEYRQRLEEGGFKVRYIELIPRPTPLSTGIEGWLDTFRAPFFAQFPEKDRAAARQQVISLIAPSLRDKSGNWTADYVRLRFAADRNDG